MIERRTRGGRLRLVDVAPVTVCATCGGEKTESGQAPVGVHVEVARGPADGRTLDTGICADCFSFALALLFGRSHIDAGGQLSDLAEPGLEG